MFRFYLHQNNRSRVLVAVKTVPTIDDVKMVNATNDSTSTVFQWKGVNFSQQGLYYSGMKKSKI